MMYGCQLSVDRLSRKASAQLVRPKNGQPKTDN